MKKVSLSLFLLLAIALVAQAQTRPAAKKPQPKSAANKAQPAQAEPQPPAKAEVKKEADPKKEEDCGCEAKTPTDTYAVVNDVKISVKEIDDAIKDKIKELQDQIVEARKQELNLQINSRLLEAEAKKRGTTANELIRQEVITKVKEPTEAEAREFYDVNKSRIQGEYKEVKAQIVAYLRQEREREAAKRLADQLRAGAQVKILSENVTPPETAADRARVFATVNGTPITSGDIEDSLKTAIYSVQDQVYGLRKQQLDMRINDILLDQEARKRNVTAVSLIESEVMPKVKKVTEEDARKFYEENKSRINGSFEQVKQQVIDYLNQQEQQYASAAFADQLRKAAKVQVFLTEPDPPVLEITTDDQPTKGGANAPVTIVEFTDYECPSCGRTQPILEEVVKEYGDRVRLVARDFPLTGMHEYAFKAAEAAEAAREQGKYWEYAAILFQNQKALGVDKLKEYASRIGLDRKKFDEALDSGKFADKVKRDMAEGESLGINSTPTIFVNGKRVRERTHEALKAAIEAALKPTAKK
jgi:protein-disulfide isomerase